MKKLFYLLFLIALFSCEKESKFCWDCYVTRTTYSPGSTYSTSSNEEKCEMSQAQIKAFEKGTTNGNTTTTASCVMQ